MDCPRTAAKASCACTYDCPRRGRCCACVAFHRGRGEFPGCFFSKAGEARWDRSLEALLRDRDGGAALR